jgi:AcrR family transcriptional regulator
MTDPAPGGGNGRRKTEARLRFWHSVAVPAPPTSRPRPLRRDAQRNRDRIVVAARACFAQEGLGVPLDEIARRAGVGVGTLYRHFPLREDLVDAVFERVLEELVAVAEEALGVDDAWQGFRSFLERALALHVENRGLKDVVATRASGRERVEAVRARMRPLVRRLAERAQAAGRLRADFAPEDVPLLFWAASRVMEATGDVAPGAWRRYLGLVLDGLRAEAATPLPEPPLTPAQLRRCPVRR